VTLETVTEKRRFVPERRHETTESHPHRVRRRWLRKLIPAGLVLAAAAGVYYIAKLPNPAQDPPAVEIPPVNVSVMHVTAAPEMADTVTLSAVVEPDYVVRVAAEVAGRIERWGERRSGAEWLGREYAAGTTVLEGEPVTEYAAGTTVLEGEPVTQGDVILHLNTDLLQARHDRAAAQYDFDEREWRRILNLSENGATTANELADARAKRDISKAALDEVARQLERAVIAAPMNGVLNKQLMKIGEYASPGDRVAEIVKLDIMKVVVDVPERDAPYLKIGDMATILTGPPRAAETTGRISYISELAHEGSRTTRVEIAVENRGQLLRSGQIVRTRLTRRMLNDVIMIPLGAVIPLEQGKLVYVVKDGRAERRDVELGFIRARDVQAVSGLQAGDVLIVEGHRYVGPGQAVRIVGEE
jgi:membrane fusion protein, multidrug efflux system